MGKPHPIELHSRVIAFVDKGKAIGRRRVIFGFRYDL